MRRKNFQIYRISPFNKNIEIKQKLKLINNKLFIK
jgi:hypothetical protein